MRRVPWVALSVLALALGIRLAAFLAPLSNLMPGCAFKRLTGFACVTCGLTRSVLALGQGQWYEAIYWYPAMAFLLVLAPLAALWDVRRAWRGDAYLPLPTSRAVRFGVWILLGGIWALQVMRGI